MADLETLRLNLLASAASIGTAQREEQGRVDDATNKAKAVKSEASEVVEAAARKASGFATPRFMGLARLGEEFHAATATVLNSPHDEIGTKLAEAMVVSYVATFTAATAKSKAGGTEAGMARVVRCGDKGATIIQALQQRLDHWNKIRDSAKESEDQAAAKATRDLADTYLVLADSDKRDDKGVVTKPRKYLGRPAANVRGIDIAAGAGTNRTSQLAQLAALYIQHGEDALHPDVVDALLNNGGKADKPLPGLADMAQRARDAVEAIRVEFGGEASRDSANLSMMVSLLDRIIAQGLASNVGTLSTPAPAPQAPPVVTPPVVTPPAPVVQAPPPLPVPQEAGDLAATLSSLPEADDSDSVESAADTLLGVTTETPPPLPAPVATPPAPTPAPRKPRTVASNPNKPRRGNVGLMG